MVGTGEGGYCLVNGGSVARKGLAFFPVQKMTIYLIDIYFWNVVRSILGQSDQKLISDKNNTNLYVSPISMLTPQEDANKENAEKDHVSLKVLSFQ